MKKDVFMTAASSGTVTRPLNKEESDLSAKLNAISAERFELEKRIGVASIKSAEAQLEMAQSQARLHIIGHELSNLRTPGQHNG